MGKVVWKGWQKDASNAAMPMGSIIKRDGTKVICITVPPEPTPKEEKQ
jgi:hypothetical protein